MLLAIDIGNTNVTVGVFKGERLLATWRAASDVHKMPDEYAILLLSLLNRQELDASDIKDGALCSVVPPLTSVFEELFQRYFDINPLVVEAGIRTGLRILSENPREVGADRVVDAVAAFRLYGGPAIVVDFGTATVFDAISKEGDYLGGAIAPGIRIAAEALFERASKLPRIELIKPKSAIGKNTVTSMQSGIVFGYVGLIEGIVARFQSELGEKARVVATGGLASIIAKETRVIDVVDLDLTLVGLRLIHELNKTH
ncbi:MAG: type III pantothenate kinase [Chloroflexi bacterium]|nr:type III pantothenate kinase [Chloroflexota bacterium]